MKRKLVQQGSSTMMISLPSKWVKENALGKGSEIDLEEKGRNIIVSADSSLIKKEITIALSDLTESLIRTLITNTYRKGYDKIIVEFNDIKQLRILESIVKEKLIGFDIIKKENKKCIVENITEPSGEQFDNLLSKVFLNIFDLFEITKKRLLGERVEESYEDVEARIQKYDNFCRRVIIKRGIDEKSTFLWAFLVLMIHGQRELYHLNKIIKEKSKVNKEVLQLLDGSKKMFELVKRAYEEKNISLLADIHKLEKSLIYDYGYKAIVKNDSRIIYHLMLSIREFYQANSQLSALLI